MQVSLHNNQLDPWAIIQQYQTDHLTKGSFGATASFVGTMRDFNDNENVSAMHLEHYPGMTEKQLSEIMTEAQQRWDIIDTLIAHRIGEIQISEPIVVTCVWSAHRAAAFEANRFLMETLKSRATFWKKESLTNSNHKQDRWVEKNTPA